MRYEELLGSHITPMEAAEMAEETTPSWRPDLEDVGTSEEMASVMGRFAERFESDILELRKIPIADCCVGWATVWEDAVQDYAERMAAGEMDYPPIIASANDPEDTWSSRWTVEDGSHRCLALRQIGITHVYAYVEVDEHLEPLVLNTTPDLPFPE